MSFYYSAHYPELALGDSVIPLPYYVLLCYLSPVQQCISQ